MNKDTNLIFEAYIEEMALRADYPKIREAIVKGLQVRAGNSYLFKKIADDTQKSPEEIVDILVKPIIDDLFPGGVYSVSGTKPESLKRLESDIVTKLSGSHPKAVSGYTARIIKNFIADVVELIDDNTEEGDTAKEAESTIDKVVAHVAAKPEEEVTAEVEAEKPSEAAAGADRITVRIEQMIANLVDDSGVLETGVAGDVVQQVLDSGGLGLEENRISGKVKAIINDLVKKKILERKGQYLKLGDNFEKFEQGGEAGSSVLSDEDLVSRYTGHGERSTTGRQVWGGEGGSRYGVDFG